jgi:hypothetical protein
MTRGKDQTKAVQDAFLVAFSECGTVDKAVKALKGTKAAVSRGTVYNWITDNTYEFRDKKEEALQVWRESLQNIGWERIKAQKPTDNPVLLLSYLNAFVPEFKRTSTADVSEAKLILAELKQLRKEQKQPTAVSAEEVDARKNAIDEVEKILSRKRESDDND